MSNPAALANNRAQLLQLTRERLISLVTGLEAECDGLRAENEAMQQRLEAAHVQADRATQRAESLEKSLQKARHWRRRR
jgi:outer membrane murein-binding lipoprotein Lpp